MNIILLLTGYNIGNINTRVRQQKAKEGGGGRASVRIHFGNMHRGKLFKEVEGEEWGVKEKWMLSELEF